MMNNPVQFIQMLRNPQAFMQNVIQKNPQLQQNQPLMNAINAMNRGDTKQAEQIARNVCQQNGMNPDQLFGQVKNKYGGMQ